MNNCNKTPTPLVSIVFPVYNSSMFLPDALDSLLQQTYKNIEILCVNDCSTDSSQTILEFYSRLDSRIRIFNHLENKGQSSARNTGIENATGNYIMFVDSDDILSKEAVELSITSISLLKTEICFFNIEGFDKQHRWLCWPEKYFVENVVANTESSEISACFSNAVMGCYSRELFDNNENRFPEGVLFEDWIFMSRLLNSRSISFCCINRPLYFYRRNFTSTSTSKVSMKTLDFFKAYQDSDQHILRSKSRGKFKIINDRNFVEGAIGYYESKMLYMDGQVSLYFLKEMIESFQAFPNSYFLDLCCNLDKVRYSMAMRMYEFQGNDFNLIVKKYRRLLYLRSIFRGFISILRKVRHPLETVKKSCLQLYLKITSLVLSR